MELVLSLTEGFGMTKERDRERNGFPITILGNDLGEADSRLVHDAGWSRQKTGGGVLKTEGRRRKTE